MMSIHHYELSALELALTCPSNFLRWANCGVVCHRAIVILIIRYKKRADETSTTQLHMYAHCIDFLVKFMSVATKLHVVIVESYVAHNILHTIRSPSRI